MKAPAKLGEPTIRVDGALKVTGRAAFPGDVAPAGLAHAVLVTSAIARGRIADIDMAAARAVPGVLDILTWREVGDAVRPVGHALGGGWANSTWRPLSGPHIRYGGQIVALVVADTFEAAREGACAVRIAYAAEAPATTLAEAIATAEPAAHIQPEIHDRRVGAFDPAFANAALRVDAAYATPIQHHNPIELPTTTCLWEGERLSVWEPTRFVTALQHGLATQLGLDPSKVRVISPFIGGHFGFKLSLSQHTALAAIAARRLHRPVRIATSRRDQFTIAHHRTDTQHRVRLGADADGRLVALAHEGVATTSRFDDFAMEGTDVTTALYACPNVLGTEKVARVDRNTPGPMRAPPEVPFLFALESAIDELAHASGIDPVELRRRNETAVDPVEGKPFTTRPLMRCFDAAAAAIDWRDRRPPRTRREGGVWVGLGCAASVRPVKAGPTIVRVTLQPGGRALVETAHHEIGNGLYTLLAMVASERLGLPLDAITVRLGDSILPPGGISGGSSTSTSLVNALAEACAQLRAKDLQTVDYAYAPPGIGADALEALRQGHAKLVTPPEGKLAWSWGAHFVEVAVDAATGEVRVRRHVGAFAAGRVLNPLTAHSQLMGGMIWGQSAALLEKTEIDRATGTYLNRDLADYLVPTALDAGAPEVLMLPDEDHAVNPEGVKGLGELGIIGVNAAIANAVFNATGRRVRRLPIRVEDLIDTG